MSFLIGLDLGQAQDYTAMAIIERVQPTHQVLYGIHFETEPHGPVVYHVRHLQRFKLGTAYPQIVADVGALARAPALGGRPDLVADATGVGRPVVDLLRAADLSPIAVTITGGTSVSGEVSSGFSVPKRDLVFTLQVLLQAGRLKFAEGLPEVPALIKELLAFEVKITASANDTYGAWRDGAHDDLVLAVALAAWYAETRVAVQTVVWNYTDRTRAIARPRGRR